jgi:signal transduction histidine kinase
MALVDQFQRFLDVKTSDPDVGRRARLLNILLTAMAALTLVAFLITIIDPRATEGQLLLLISILVFFIGCGLIYLVNRHVSPRLAGWMLSLLLIVIVGFGDLPEEVLSGRSLFLFSIPILVSSFIISAPSSFWVALWVNITLGALAISNQIIPELVVPVAFFLLAVVSWLAATSLERAVQEARQRTLELETAQSRLIRQEKLAVLGQMAGSVAHELRNPLGVISNSGYYIDHRFSSLDEKLEEHIRFIRTNTATAEKIISDLLDFSRVQKSDPTVISPSTLTTQVCEHFSPPDGVQVVLEDSVSNLEIQIDPVQIHQILINFLSNAAQSMDNGGVVKIGSFLEHGAVHIYVEDSGSGISESALVEIFDPLFTTKRGGIGLGLSISRTLAEANGGHIQVSSVIGEGSTFTLVLPADSAA